MTYKTDLEESVRESYQLIREFEEILRFSSDPKEKARARRTIEEQWMLIKGYIDEYTRVCERLQISIADDLVEVMSRFPQYGDAKVISLIGDVTRSPTQEIEIFISYAHEDEQLRNELVKQLSLLKWQGLINEWHDRQISPGRVWTDEIDAHLNTAQIILLLISADFMASAFCYGVEMEWALKRQSTGGTVIIPIILRPVDWKSAPFGNLQVLPKDGKPITDWANRDSAFLNVAEGIRKVVEELKTKN